MILYLTLHVLSFAEDLWRFVERTFIVLIKHQYRYTTTTEPYPHYVGSAIWIIRYNCALLVINSLGILLTNISRFMSPPCKNIKFYAWNQTFFYCPECLGIITKINLVEPMKTKVKLLFDKVNLVKECGEDSVRPEHAHTKLFYWM